MSCGRRDGPERLPDNHGHAWDRAGTAFETRVRRAAGASAAIGTCATVRVGLRAIRASATAIASTVASAAAERPLETLKRIAADAGRSRGNLHVEPLGANARGTRFTWRRIHVFLEAAAPSAPVRAGPQKSLPLRRGPIRRARVRHFMLAIVASCSACS